MVEAARFVDAAREAGFDWYTSVPCSFLTPLLNAVLKTPGLEHYGAANEGDAVALATGASLGGRRTVVMMQNSGLGNAVSPLSSLTHPYRVPLLLICTQRGEPGLADEPQHELMGRITCSLLETLEIPWEYFPEHNAEVAPALARAKAHFETASRPYALVLRKGTVAAESLELPAARPARPSCRPQVLPAAQAPREPELPTRSDALRCLLESASRPGQVLVATTGYTGRELFALDDRPRHLYMVGSMGCASALGLGLALARPDLPVIVVDGDGAALMRMGNFATLGHYGPPNLTHLLLDNGCHDSTGGQPTVSASVDFAGVAAACGYAEAWRVTETDGLTRVLNAPWPAAGPRFVHLRTRPGAPESLPRPTITPEAALRRLQRALREQG